MSNKVQTLYRVYKIRSVKSYPDAKNHLIVGRVIEETESYVHLDGRALHFGRNVNSAKDVRVSGMGERIIPWHRIEVINVLPPEFNVEDAELIELEESIVFHEGNYSCAVVNAYERSF